VQGMVTENNSIVNDILRTKSPMCHCLILPRAYAHVKCKTRRKVSRKRQYRDLLCKGWSLKTNGIVNEILRTKSPMCHCLILPRVYARVKSCRSSDLEAGHWHQHPPHHSRVSNVGTWFLLTRDGRMSNSMNDRFLREIPKSSRI